MYELNIYEYTMLEKKPNKIYKLMKFESIIRNVIKGLNVFLCT